MEILKQYAMQFVGVPYKFGGKNPLEGVDCSELIQELLRSVGLDPPGDQTAQSLFDYFEGNSARNTYGCGALVFYGDSVRKITHVAMMLDEYRVIEAGGGDRQTVDRAAAIRQSAFVRIRHVDHRKDKVAVLRPYYSTVGSL